MSNNFYSLRVNSGNFFVELYANSLTASYTLPLPGSAPTDGQLLRWNNTNSTLEWATISTGGGSVTSIALGLPTSVFDVSSAVTTSGTVTGTFKSQTKNTALMSPAAADGVPSFRAIANADLPASIDASKISGTLAKANIPSGTNATSFQISGTSGCTLSTNAGGDLIINGADGTTRADLYCKNIFVTGTIDTQSTNNVNYGDSTITLLSDFNTGVPSLDGGFNIRRGSSANAQFLWNETSDRFQFGTSDNLKDGSRSANTQITNANITGGTFTFTHNLKATDKDPEIIVKRNDGRGIVLGYTYTSADVVTIDFSRVGTIAGTWNITAIV